MSCYKDTSKIECQLPCERFLKCSHQCTLKCYQKCSINICQELVENILDCGHIV